MKNKGKKGKGDQIAGTAKGGRATGEGEAKKGKRRVQGVGESEPGDDMQGGCFFRQLWTLPLPPEPGTFLSWEAGPRVE